MNESSSDDVHFDATAEQRVLDAISTRQVADFSALPASERGLRAEFLQALISGSHESHGELCCPLRIRGAEIAGGLRPPSGLVPGGRMALQFHSCTFDAPVDLSGGDFLVLRFIDCRLPAFVGTSLNVRANLDLSGSQFSGVEDYESELSHVGKCAIHLNHARVGGRLELAATSNSRFTAVGPVEFDGARIDGDVSLSGALLDGRGMAALSARGATIGGNVNLTTAAGHRFEATGEVVFVAAQITGDLDCEASRLINPEGRALHCEDLQVESVFLTARNEGKMPFEAAGRLNFLTAIIGGSLFMTNARLVPGPDYLGLLKKGGPIAINLQQVRISNALVFSNISAKVGDAPPTPRDGARQPVQGWFLLTGAQLNAVLDNVETGWPAAGFLDLESTTYTSIYNIGGGDLTAKRIAWLRRLFPGGRPTADSFRPHAYEELSRVLRSHGQTSEADAIAVEKIRMRLASRIDRPWARLFPRLLMLISHHGYSTGRAMLSFLVFVLLGTAMYATALFAFQQTFVPVDGSPEPVNYRFAFGMLQQQAAAGCAGLDILHYALDTALPVIDLSQDLRCRFTPQGPARWLWLLLHSLYTIAGAALSAVVVLTLTGVLRRE